MTWDDIICKEDDTSRNDDATTSPEEKLSIQEVQIPKSQNLLDDSSWTTSSKVMNDKSIQEVQITTFTKFTCWFIMHYIQLIVKNDGAALDEIWKLREDKKEEFGNEAKNYYNHATI